MKSAWNHLQFNIEPANRAFYKDLLTLLGWEPWHEDDKMLGMGVEGKGSFWFAAASGKKQTDYDQLGVNHIGVRADEQRGRGHRREVPERTRRGGALRHAPPSPGVRRG